MYQDDPRLLADFIEQSDPEAFAALVARHGPMVLRVCRGVLIDAHLAEDAFQATFLTLFQKAGAIRDPNTLRGWLCGTAYKTASRIRKRSIRLSQRERTSEVDPTDPDQAQGPDYELFLLVREELDLLPEKYRAPLILCYLEGLTHEEAASQLEWASGTVKVRLVRGRKLLRERLDRRKVAMATGLVLLWRREAGAADPGFVESTLRAAETITTSQALARPTVGSSSLPRIVAPPMARWAMLRRALLILAVTAALAATAAAAVILPTSPPPAGDGHEDLPGNLTDVLGIDCT
ncbi:RNA polymerase sigma factor [Planctomyces sp. SH-PL62]|uniref:RNA polymerase sigma factor n=1 Tax=Planctomyces sp. SH-PL62 TaxID=1636152 RepID=UPI00078B5513|nr:RNA polymerase sigma factor [Planctomyces sp. SH-PL62]AMV39919.1 ECF RNA polymerase sigma factor SigE [Planctomyces sp. SH-PL62]